MASVARGVRRPERVRSHDFVADQLRRQIALRLILPGGALPTQRELARMFGVGRATADRAVRVLEAEGLVVSRRGRAGGRFVTGPTSEHERLQGLLDEVRRRRDAIEQALVFRQAVEPAAAAQAALVCAPVAVARLRAAASAADAARDDAELAQRDTEFHLAVAHAAQNGMMVEAVERIRMELVPALLVLPDTDSWHRRTSREHRVVVRAVERGDAEAARRGMAMHLRQTERSIAALLAAL